MMKLSKKVLCGLLFFAALPVISQTVNDSANQSDSSVKAKSKAAHAVGERDGQKVFEQNCSRCHSTPQGFSPRISGTVARHMRVRAGLSKEDEQAVLRFLNP
jgi:cytochrome c5